MCDVEFRGWPKIGRDNPLNVTITEKINGTNACIVIIEGELVKVQSRNRFITPQSDNAGFAKWVEEHKDELLSLGDGYHYGEWAGPGIQKNPLQLKEKHFFLFDTFRWDHDNPNLPACCDVVPILYQGILTPELIPALLEDLKAKDTEREGVVVFYHAFRTRTKHTIKSPDGKWCK